MKLNGNTGIGLEEKDEVPFSQMPWDNHSCVLKKCCKAYKKKNRHCKKCPKL